MEKIISKGYVSHVQRDVCIAVATISGVFGTIPLFTMISTQPTIPKALALAGFAVVSFIFFKLAGKRPI